MKQHLIQVPPSGLVNRTILHLNKKKRKDCVTGSENGGSSKLVDQIVILRRDHSAYDDQNIRAAKFVQDVDQFRNQRPVGGR